MAHTKPKTVLAPEQRIAAARQRLQELYDARGGTDAAVLAASIDLDRLLNEAYRRMRRGERQDQG